MAAAAVQRKNLGHSSVRTKNPRTWNHIFKKCSNAECCGGAYLLQATKTGAAFCHIFGVRPTLPNNTWQGRALSDKTWGWSHDRIAGYRATKMHPGSAVAEVRGNGVVFRSAKNIPGIFYWPVPINRRPALVSLFNTTDPLYRE